MRKIMLMTIIIFIPVILFAGEFQWTRVKITLVKDGKELRYTDEEELGESDADLQLLEALEKATTLKVNKKINVISLEKMDEICNFPLIFIHAQEEAVLNEKEVKNLKDYIKRGGFVFIDDCVNEREDYDSFFRTMKREIETKVFPEKRMTKISNNHEIYKCFYTLPNGTPYIQGKDQGGWGYFDEKDKLRIFMCATDIQCGWKEKYAGFWGADKRLEAIKMGINIIMYVLTH